MGLHAFLAGSNAVCYTKNNRKFGMICAWATMIDYDVIGLLIGEQSSTGKNLEVGMTIGVSALSAGQKDIALQLGNNHSDIVDKFVDLMIVQNGSAILIAQARSNMVCEVMKLYSLTPENNDIFVVAKVIDASEDHKKEFLSAEEVFGRQSFD
ncbi:MAG: flavin reductase [Bacilli bacterium]|jgi:flavin reductase (DIM6/NTAB) family NADH-FMN oxidoreductase RutF